MRLSLRVSTALAAIATACSVGGCFGGGARESGTSESDRATSTLTSPPATTSTLTSSPAIEVIERELPSVGQLVIVRTKAHGLTIRDRATDGRKFFLSEEQAGECLDFLRANPAPTQQAIEAACPGRRP
jgi:hypothetical protein